MDPTRGSRVGAGMHVVQVLPSRRSRALLIVAVAAIGALAWRSANRPAPRPPLVACAIPDVAQDQTVSIEPPHFAVPPPGDPYPRPPVEAVLIDGPDNLPDCGIVMWEAAMVFHPLKSTGDGDLTVMVGCTRLQRHHRYLLWLERATDVPGHERDVIYRAIRVEAR